MWVWHHSFCPSYHPQNGCFTTIKVQIKHNSADSCTFWNTYVHKICKDFWPILYYITLLLIICKNVNRQSKLHLDDAKNKANVWISSTTVIPLWSELVAYFNEMHHYSLIFLPCYCFLYIEYPSQFEYKQ